MRESLVRRVCIWRGLRRHWPAGEENAETGGSLKALSVPTEGAYYLHMADINIFAATDWRNQRKRFGIRREDRRLHMYVIGRTGMGKTSLLLNMALNDIKSGEGVCFIDPHGDAVRLLRNAVPSARLRDTVYFSPADATKPIGLNILDDSSTTQRHLIVSGVISIFSHLYGHNWQHRQEHILRNALFALLDQEASHTLLSVYRLLIDASFRKQVIAGIKDPMVKTFWQVEYPRYLFSKSDALVTLLNKLGGFLTVPLIRDVVGKATSDIDFRGLMDQRKVLLVNLSKGRLGEDNAAFLGALVLLKLQLAAMSRANTPEHKRKDFYVYVDEAQSFVGVQGIDHLLSEARKYRLCLTMSHQYLGQLNDEMRQAIFGNVGTTVCFAVGPEDAGTLEKEFTPVFSRQDLVDQPKHHIYLRLAIDGKSSRPFSAVTLPPLAYRGLR